MTYSFPFQRCIGLWLVLAVGCVGGAPSDGNDGGGNRTDSGSDSGAVVDGGTERSDGGSEAATVARKLNLPPNFLVGMGNDLAGAPEGYDHNRDGIYTLGTKLDLHSVYLVGLSGQGGWPDWNPNGSFVNIMTDVAYAHGIVPFFTLYSMAAWGDGNLSGLSNDDFMRRYWAGATLLFDRLAIFNKPALVHLEPDFWAYAQLQSPAGDPSQLQVRVSLAQECADLPNDLTGMGRCLLRLARNHAPRAVVGFHASRWAGTPAATASFLTRVGAGAADLIVVDMLDRDAGCFEAHVDPQCQRTDGPWYWDESNRTSPNFHEYLDWSRTVALGLRKPILWWQIPFGVPSSTPGGTAGHYRDNRVHYIFSHLQEFVSVGGLGVVFATGAGNQTYITTDGDQFKRAVSTYFAMPTPL
jgi:hypothetical protein